MALVYKVTKITNKGNSPTSPLDYIFSADFYNFTIPSAPIQTVTTAINKEEASDPTLVMDAFDAVLAGLGTDAIDWTK